MRFAILLALSTLFPHGGSPPSRASDIRAEAAAEAMRDVSRGQPAILVYGSHLEGYERIVSCLAASGLAFSRKGCIVGDDDISFVETYNRVTETLLTEAQRTAVSHCHLKVAVDACSLRLDVLASNLNLDRTCPAPSVRAIDGMHPTTFLLTPASALWSINSLCPLPRVVPHQLGVKIFSLYPGSVWMQVGLNNGDVIESVNGILATTDFTPSDLVTLQKSRRLMIAIRRHGVPITIAVLLTDH